MHQPEAQRVGQRGEAMRDQAERVGRKEADFGPGISATPASSATLATQDATLMLIFQYAHIIWQAMRSRTAATNA